MALADSGRILKDSRPFKLIFLTSGHWCRCLEVLKSKCFDFLVSLWNVLVVQSLVYQNPEKSSKIKFLTLVSVPRGLPV